MGDFNINNLDKRAFKPSYLLTSEHQLEEIMTSATRHVSESIIDHIYVSQDDIVLKSGVL